MSYTQVIYLWGGLFVMNFTIETSQLLLRPFTMMDVQDYFNITRDELVRKYTPGIYTVSLLETEFFFKMCYTKQDFLHDFYIGIEEKKEKKLIGGIIVTQNQYSEIFDCSYFISKNYRQKGYMLEALESFLKNFPITGSLLFEINNSNLASLNLIKKIEGIEELGLDFNMQNQRFYYHVK